MKWHHAALAVVILITAWHLNAQDKSFQPFGDNSKGNNAPPVQPLPPPAPTREEQIKQAEKNLEKARKQREKLKGKEFIDNKALDDAVTKAEAELAAAKALPPTYTPIPQPAPPLVWPPKDQPQPSKTQPAPPPAGGMTPPLILPPYLIKDLPTPEEEFRHVEEARKALKQAIKQRAQLKGKEFIDQKALDKAVQKAEDDLDDAWDDYDDYLDYLDYLEIVWKVDVEKIWRRQEEAKKAAADPNAPFRAKPDSKDNEPFGGIRLNPDSSYLPGQNLKEIDRLIRPHLDYLTPSWAQPSTNAPETNSTSSVIWPPMRLRPENPWGTGDGRSSFDLFPDGFGGKERSKEISHSAGGKSGCSCKPTCTCKPKCSCK